MEKSLHPGGMRRPNQISYESPVIVEEPVVEEPVEEEVTVFNPEEAATDGNPFPEEEPVEEEPVEEEPVEEEPVEEEPVDYDSMTVAVLRGLLEERGLATNGLKAELVARLEEDDTSLSEESETLDASEEAPSEEAASSEEEVSQYGGTEEQ